jgi:hypothetical protein
MCAELADEFCQRHTWRCHLRLESVSIHAQVRCGIPKAEVVAKWLRYDGDDREIEFVLVGRYYGPGNSLWGEIQHGLKLVGAWYVAPSPKPGAPSTVC